MLKKLCYMIGLSGLVLSLNACFENPSYVYEGASVAEFKNTRAGFATQPANNVSNSSLTRTVRQGLGRDSILVQLVGVQRSTPTTIAYTIDPSSTAVEGTNFTIIGMKGTVTIPANNNAGYIVVQFLPGIPTTAPTTQTVRLIMTLTGAESTSASANYRTFTFIIRN